MRHVVEHAVVATVTAPGVPDMFPEIPAVALLPVGTIIRLPRVPRTKLPFVAVIFPNVAVIVVPAVTVVVAARDVVAVNDPGVVIALGRLQVMVLAVPVVTI